MATLIHDDGKLWLVNDQDRKTRICVDFLNPNFLRRLKSLGKNTVLLKAIGDKNKSPLNIVDATAGLGRDAFLMASRGHHVTLFEQSPIVFQLLDDGLKRAREDFPEILARMTWEEKNSLENMPAADVIYLDPMFPDTNKSALAKKDMQLLQSLLGHTDSAETLLKKAQPLARKRVVLKRPKLAPVTGKPDIQYKSKTHRFDVYLNRV